jgi:hypothetical protein
MERVMVVERERIIERPVEVERPVERETIVETGGGAAALIAGVLFAAILALLFFWIFAGNRTPSVDVEVSAPTQSAN